MPATVHFDSAREIPYPDADLVDQETRLSGHAVVYEAEAKQHTKAANAGKILRCMELRLFFLAW